MKRSLSLQLVAFVAIRTVLNTMIRMVYPFLSVFGSGLGVDIRTISLAVTFRSGFSILGPFLAYFADRRGRKFGMLFGLFMFTTGVGLMVIWPSFPTFVATLVITLLGNLVFIPSMQAYLGDKVPYERRSTAIAITELGWSLSFILIVPAMGLLIVGYGWRAPFPVLTLLGFLGMLVVLILIPKERPPAQGDSAPWTNLRLVFVSLPAVAGLLLGASMAASNELVNLTFAVWMDDAFAVKIAALAVLSVVIGVAELGGEGLVGLLTDRVGKRRAVSIGLIVNSAAALLLPVFGRTLEGGFVGLFLFYISFEFAIVSSITLMTGVLPQARATMMASYIASVSGGRALGAFLAPYLYGIGTLPGILVIVIAAAGFNLVAILALQRVITAE